jgi:chromosome segregation ATPase
MANLRAEIRGKSSGAFLQYAFFRVESAVVVAGTILLTFFWHIWATEGLSWLVWVWPVLGLAAWGVVIYSSLTDPEASAKVLWQLLIERLELEKIEESTLRERIEAMSRYIRAAETDLYRASDSPNRSGLNEAVGLMYEWVAQSALFARYADTYRRDYRLEERRAELPNLTETLVARLKYEKQPDIIDRLNAEMEVLGKDWQNLELLEAQMQQAEPQLGRMLTALARAAGEIHVIAAERGPVPDHLDNLKADIERHLGQVTDLVTQIAQLYADALRKR